MMAAMPDPATTCDDLADLAERTALAAAALLREGLHAGGARGRRPSRRATDMVTEMDRAAERLIVDVLLAARPDDGLLGEEGADSAGTSGRPLGDRPARRHHQLPLRPPRLRRLHRRRARGSGRGRRGRRRPHRRRVPGHAGRWRHPQRHAHPGLRRDRPGPGPRGDRVRLPAPTSAATRPRCWPRILGQIRDIRRMGSAALDLCSVACGRVDAYYELGLGRGTSPPARSSPPRPGPP